MLFRGLRGHRDGTMFMHLVVMMVVVVVMMMMVMIGRFCPMGPRITEIIRHAQWSEGQKSRHKR